MSTMRWVGAGVGAGVVVGLCVGAGVRIDDDVGVAGAEGAGVSEGGAFEAPTGDDEVGTAADGPTASIDCDGDGDRDGDADGDREGAAE